MLETNIVPTACFAASIIMLKIKKAELILLGQTLYTWSCVDIKHFSYQVFYWKKNMEKKLLVID